MTIAEREEALRRIKDMVEKKLEELYEILLERRRKKREKMQEIEGVIEDIKKRKGKKYTDVLFGDDREEYLSSLKDES